MDFAFQLHQFHVFGIDLLLNFGKLGLNPWLLLLPQTLETIMSFHQVIILFRELLQFFIQQVDLLIAFINGPIKLFIILLVISL